MIIERTIYLYSNNNYEFAYKIKKICKEKFYIVKNINNFADLFIEASFKVPLLFVDWTGLANNKEIKNMLIKLTPTYFKKLVIFFADASLGENKNIFIVKDETNLEKDVLNILALNDVDALQIEDLTPEETWIKKVSEYLLSKGFYLKHLGSQMIRDSIIYCYKNPSAVSSLSATAYNFLATKYNTSLSNVERSIRRSIEFAVKCNKISSITNKEFIMVALADVFDSLYSVD